MMEHVTLPPMHFKKRVRGQYNDLAFAIIRESVQNAYDAGATRLLITIADGYFKAEDDGCGMTLQQTRHRYLTIGASVKGDEAVGVFGVAKEVVSFAHESWFLEGQGFRIEGCGSTFEVVEEGPYAGRSQGFCVGAHDSDNLDVYKLSRAAQVMAARSDIDMKIEVVVDGGDSINIEMGRTLRSNQFAHEFDCGKLYVHKSSPGPLEHTGVLYVRTRGLYTCYLHVPGDKVWYLDLDEASNEVLTDNRDSLRWSVRNSLTKEIRARVDSGRADEGSAASLTLHRKEPMYHGDTSDDNHVFTERGSFEAAAVVSNLWRKPWVVASERGPVRVKTKSGNPRPAFTHALEVFDTAARLIANVTGYPEPIVGLYFGPEGDARVNAIHAMLEDKEVIAARPELVEEESAFGIIDMMIHEFAHYTHSSHNQTFERERRGIAKTCGSVMTGMIHTVKRAMEKPMQYGRYWEE